MTSKLSHYVNLMDFYINEKHMIKNIGKPEPNMHNSLLGALSNMILHHSANMYCLSRVKHYMERRKENQVCH